MGEAATRFWKRKYHGRPTREGLPRRRPFPVARQDLTQRGIAGKLTPQVGRAVPGERTLKTTSLFTARQSFSPHFSSFSSTDRGQAASPAFRRFGGRLAHLPGVLSNGSARRIYAYAHWLARSVHGHAGRCLSTSGCWCPAQPRGERVVVPQWRLRSTHRHILSLMVFLALLAFDRVAFVLLGSDQPIAAGVAGTAGKRPHSVSPVCAVERGVASGAGAVSNGDRAVSDTACAEHPLGLWLCVLRRSRCRARARSRNAPDSSQRVWQYCPTPEAPGSRRADGCGCCCRGRGDAVERRHRLSHGEYCRHSAALDSASRRVLSSR